MIKTITMPLVEGVSQVPAIITIAVVVALFALGIAMMVALIRTKPKDRPVKMYHWLVKDDSGNSTRVIAPSHDAAVAEAANDVFGMYAVRLRLHLGQYIPDEDQTPQ